MRARNYDNNNLSKSPDNNNTRGMLITNSNLMKNNKAKRYNDINLLDQSISSEMNSDKFRVTSNKNANISKDSEITHNYMKQTLRSSQGIQPNSSRNNQNKQYAFKANSNSNQKNQGLATTNSRTGNGKISNISHNNNQASNDYNQIQQGHGRSQVNMNMKGDKYNKNLSKSSDLVNSYADEAETNKTDQSNLSRNEGSGINIYLWSFIYLFLIEFLFLKIRICLKFSSCFLGL